MATIREVAKHAGVSVATVSRVLNNKGYVSTKTKESVLDSIETLKYKPNDVARSLFKGKSKMIALLVPDIMNPFFPELARSVEDICNEQGYTFVLCNTDDSREKERSYLSALQQKSVDGFVIVSSTMTKEDAEEVKVPIISLDRIFNESISSVTVENKQGAKIAVEFLKSTGCKRIAHITGHEHASNTRERLRGYLDVVENADWFTSDYIVTGNYNMDTAKTEVTKLLKENQEVDGVFAGNDVMAIGALKAAEALNIRVPEELSIIGFDGIALGETTSPALTTISQPIYKIGSRAAQLLIEKINGTKHNREVSHVNFPVELIERESTRKRVL